MSAVGFGNARSLCAPAEIGQAVWRAACAYEGRHRVSIVKYYLVYVWVCVCVSERSCVCLLGVTLLVVAIWSWIGSVLRLRLHTRDKVMSSDWLAAQI